MLTIHCSQCGGPMSIMPQMAGSPVACPHCGRVFSAPADPNAPVTPLPMAAPVEPGEQSGMPQPQMMQYGRPPEQKISALAVASLVFGIMGACMPIFGVTGVVLGLIARSSINANALLTGRKMAIWGIILGAVTAVLHWGYVITHWDETMAQFQHIFGG